MQPADSIQQQIFVIRGKRVMLSPDLARLYGVETKALMQAVRRNKKRFPPDFMFQITLKEALASRSQFVTLNDPIAKRGTNVKYLPYAFTEQGVAMLSSVLRSERAIRVNILIMRAFARLREIIAGHKELAAKLRDLESRVDQHDEHIRAIFEAIRQLIGPDPPGERRTIGY